MNRPCLGVEVMQKQQQRRVGRRILFEELRSETVGTRAGSEGCEKRPDTRRPVAMLEAQLFIQWLPIALAIKSLVMSVVYMALIQGFSCPTHPVSYPPSL